MDLNEVNLFLNKKPIHILQCLIVLKKNFKGCIFWKFCAENYDPKLIRSSKKVQKAFMMHRLRKALNEAVKDLERNVDKEWREIEKHEMKSMGLIHDLFFARII